MTRGRRVCLGDREEGFPVSLSPSYPDTPFAVDFCEYMFCPCPNAPSTEVSMPGFISQRKVVNPHPVLSIFQHLQGNFWLIQHVGIRDPFQGLKSKPVNEPI